MSENLREMVILARENGEVGALILKSFEPLMKKCIKIYVRDFTYFEDGMQEARVAVLQCIKRYDIESAYPFEAYVKRAVIYSVRDFAERIKFNFSLDEEINEDGGTLHDVLESDEDIEGEEIHREEIRSLKRAFDELPENYRDVLYRFYFEKKSLRELAGNRRCHYMTVVKLKERALKSLRERMESMLPGFDE